jgi:glutathione S-transferase
MKLLIFNKNYSSWSLRPWLVLRELGIPFEEEKLSINDPKYKERIAKYAPVGKVPVLVTEDGMAIWESIAIIEYAADAFPQAGVWPADPRARARARSLCAEMHAGFSALRNAFPMNIEARLPGRGWSLEVQTDIDRIVDRWTATRAEFGRGGAFLFGKFCAADAFFAPVVSRFVTHAVEVPPVARTYMNAVLELHSMKEWTAAARAEQEYVAMDEPYRRSRG